MLAALTRAVEARHPWTRGHAGRVADLATAVARSLGWDTAQVERVRLGSLVHDVGKLSLATELLGKPGPLSMLELAQVRTHPTAGARLVAQTHGAEAAVPCVLFHHERWDGSGYPFGVSGPSIPIEARLVALADAFDAMTSPRPYRGPMTVEAALAELANCAGTQFDPVLAHAAIETWSSASRVAV
jgi:HD-GYP domain-containing protein (c-di-GMP phosphodiesterase class II)